MKGNKSINRLSQKDLQFLHTLHDVGHIPICFNKYHSNALSISNNRIHTFLNCNWLEKIYQNNNYYLKLGKEGIKNVNHLIDKKNYISTSAIHDSKLLETYLSLSQETRNTWVTERELKDMFFKYTESLYTTNPLYACELEQKYKDGFISCPDGMYTDISSGVLQAIEIVSSFYSQEMINSKIEFCEVMNIEFNMERTN